MTTYRGSVEVPVHLPPHGPHLPVHVQLHVPHPGAARASVASVQAGA